MTIDVLLMRLMLGINMSVYDSGVGLGYVKPYKWKRYSMVLHYNANGKFSKKTFSCTNKYRHILEMHQEM